MYATNRGVTWIWYYVWCHGLLELPPMRWNQKIVFWRFNLQEVHYLITISSVGSVACLRSGPVLGRWWHAELSPSDKKLKCDWGCTRCSCKQITLHWDCGCYTFIFSIVISTVTMVTIGVRDLALSCKVTQLVCGRDHWGHCILQY